MTTILKMMSTPMAPYMGLMKGMTREQKLTVVAYLVDTMQDEEQHFTADEEFVRQFLATPYDNPMTADEAKQQVELLNMLQNMNIEDEDSEAVEETDVTVEDEE